MNKNEKDIRNSNTDSKFKLLDLNLATFIPQIQNDDTLKNQ